MLNQFILVGEMYRFTVCIGNPHYVYREEPTQYFYEQQQGDEVAEQPDDSCGNEFGADQLPHHQQEVIINSQFLIFS